MRSELEQVALVSVQFIISTGCERDVNKHMHVVKSH